MNTRAFLCLALMAFSQPAFAENKYDAFVKRYMAANIIAQKCGGLVVFDVPSATEVAVAEYGLRKQKTLRILFYGVSSQLNALGNAMLVERDVDPNNNTMLCRFGNKRVGTKDEVGRFLVRQ